MRVVNLNKLGLIIAIIISIIYFYQGYSFISSINSYIGDEVWYPPAAKNILIYVFGDVNIINNGYPYPDENGINNYLNLEHPPLAKYIMALAILIGGYEPIIWRIPSLLLGSFILILAYTIGRKLQGFYCGIIALIIAFFDPMLRTMSYVGMLDIYSAFFALLSFYIMLLKKPELGSLAFGLSIASKETALAEIFSFTYQMTSIEKSISRRIIYIIILPLLFYFIINIPIISYLGFNSWLSQSLLHMASWDLQSGHATASYQVSPPWGWLFNINPFPLHFQPDISASTNVIINILAIGLSILFLPYVIKKRDNTIITLFLYAWSPIFMFSLVWLYNQTLFTFYEVLFTTFIDILTSYLIVKLVEEYKEILEFWKELRLKL